MWTQRDQIQAYQFLRRRLVSALVAADANPPVSPSRRLVLGTVLGIAATLIITAGFGIVGVLKPNGGTDWKKPGQVLIEKETGTRYVLAGDGALHPVLNFASARLLAGGGGNKTTMVPAKKLASVSRGVPLGIAGAPDSLPSAKRLEDGPATVCSRLVPDQPAAARPQTVFRWTSTPSGRSVADGQGVLVTDGAELPIISGGYRFRVPGTGPAAALGLEGRPAMRVSSAWLSAIPSGVDLSMLTVNDAGDPGPQVGGHRIAIATVLQTLNTAGTGEFYLALASGIAPISPAQAVLVLSNPANRKGSAPNKPLELTADLLDGVSRTQLPERLSGATTVGSPPALAELPELVRPTATAPLCLVMSASSAQLLVVDPAVDLTSGTETAESDAGLLADRILVPAATGGLVSTRPENALAKTYLIADSGQKFLVPSADAMKALGYSKVTPVPLPSALLALLPDGPALDPAAAQRPSPTVAR
jgi:type VII secretion protein EccB